MNTLMSSKKPAEMINVQGRSAGKVSINNFTENAIDIYWPGGSNVTSAGVLSSSSLL